MDISKDWDKWQNTLDSAIYLGETVGMSDKTMTNIPEKVGTLLADNVDPKNPEERLLKKCGCCR